MRDSAFGVNRLGFGGTPFPLSFSAREVDGSWRLDATAATAAELADLVVAAANETILVVDLATTSFLDEEYRQWPPSRIAAEQGVDGWAHQLGTLASGVVGLSEEVLVLRRDDLPRFLAGWSPYELTLVDLPAPPSAERLDEIALTLGTAAHHDPVLPALVGSRVWFSGHDDCYVALESTDPALPAAVLGRLLALLAGTALDDAVAEPDGALVADLVTRNAHWVGAVDRVSADSVTVNLTATSARWRLSAPPPDRVDHTVVLDRA
ncbi:hypothetical protein ABTZ99_37375 [Actinosynnema sp. NPDC002837]